VRVKQVTSLVVLAAALVLAACASTPPVTSSAPSADPANVRATAAAPRTDTGFKPPADYRRVMVDGQEKFCRKFFPTGSRVESQTECLTENELKARLEANRITLEDEMRARAATSGGNAPAGLGH
jgi:hypothetical protein